MTKPRNAHEHYRREVERRAKQVRPENEIMAAARREYEALLEAQASKGKGGRPRKKVAKAVKKSKDEFDLEEFEGSTDEE
jgi:hypothetical protein